VQYITYSYRISPSTRLLEAFVVLIISATFRFVNNLSIGGFLFLLGRSLSLTAPRCDIILNCLFLPFSPRTLTRKRMNTISYIFFVGIYKIPWMKMTKKRDGFEVEEINYDFSILSRYATSINAVTWWAKEGASGRNEFSILLWRAKNIKARERIFITQISTSSCHTQRRKVSVTS
jgi:hypothetical protein